MRPPVSLDLNADVGEEPEALASGREERLLAEVTSANVATGGHAGDETSMRALARLCRAHGVALGAHPAYPDRAGFGRSPPRRAHPGLEAELREQLSTLARVAQEQGLPLSHVKAHGALYHEASRDPGVAAALARAARAVAPGALLVAEAGSEALIAFRRAGARTLAEAFADRRYGPDGTLVPRGAAGALITDPGEAAAQALSIALRGQVGTLGGRTRPLVAETLCVHGDTPGAPALARAVREALERSGVRCRAPRG